MATLTTQLCHQLNHLIITLLTTTMPIHQLSHPALHLLTTITITATTPPFTLPCILQPTRPCHTLKHQFILLCTPHQHNPTHRLNHRLGLLAPTSQEVL